MQSRHACDHDLVTPPSSNRFNGATDGHDGASRASDHCYGSNANGGGEGSLVSQAYATALLVEREDLDGKSVALRYPPQIATLPTDAERYRATGA
jgi:hypothetical protein